MDGEENLEEKAKFYTSAHGSMETIKKLDGRFIVLNDEGLNNS